MQLSADGLHLLASSKDNSVRLWDTRAARPLRAFKGHQNTCAAATLQIRSARTDGRPDETTSLISQVQELCASALRPGARAGALGLRRRLDLHLGDVDRRAGAATARAPSLYLPCTFPAPSLYLPCTSAS